MFILSSWFASWVSKLRKNMHYSVQVFVSTLIRLRRDDVAKTALPKKMQPKYDAEGEKAQAQAIKQNIEEVKRNLFDTGKKSKDPSGGKSPDRRRRSPRKGQQGGISTEDTVAENFEFEMLEDSLDRLKNSLDLLDRIRELTGNTMVLKTGLMSDYLSLIDRQLKERREALRSDFLSDSPKLQRAADSSANQIRPASKGSASSSSALKSELEALIRANSNQWLIVLGKSKKSDSFSILHMSEQLHAAADSQKAMGDLINFMDEAFPPAEPDSTDVHSADNEESSLSEAVSADISKLLSSKDQPQNQNIQQELQLMQDAIVDFESKSDELHRLQLENDRLLIVLEKAEAQAEDDQVQKERVKIVRDRVNRIARYIAFVDGLKRALYGAATRSAAADVSVAAASGGNNKV